MSNDNAGKAGRPQRRHSAGLFDIRNIIGALLGIYGIVLLLTYFFDGSARAASGSAHSRANLWMGVALLVAGSLFIWWSRARPTLVDEAQVAADKEAADQATEGDSA